MSPAQRVVGRLAPSPTGPLHLGHARSFLAAWWSARSAGGRILLRSEDLDLQRCKPEFERAQIQDLKWLGLDWDGPLLRQSDDLQPYLQALKRLEESGAVYACVCTRKEIEEAIDAPHGAGDERRYLGTCRGRFKSRQEAEYQTGLPAGLRLRVPAGPLETVDRLRGPQRFDTSQECGDFLLLRRDGGIAYQLAVVVDDARQGVTQVVRGDDLLPSAVRQELLYRAFGWRVPDWYHLPLVLASDGRRLSKRAGDAGLSAWREHGRDPRELVGWCAQSLGLWPRDVPPPRLDPAGWLPHWSWAKVPSAVALAPAPNEYNPRRPAPPGFPPPPGTGA
jgi:glutamyl-tRNA synthetase